SQPLRNSALLCGTLRNSISFCSCMKTYFKKSGMNTLVDKKNERAIKVWFDKDMLFVLLEDGRELGTPLQWFPKLQSATREQLENYRLIGNGVGIHWEE